MRKCVPTAGLGPATYVLLACEMGRWVYIVTNRPNGTLYVGCTTGLARPTRKVRLIHRDNPFWEDLYDRLA